MDLATLGYNKTWIEMGFLTEEDLNYQLEFYSKNQHKNTADFRYSTCLAWLEEKEKFSNKEIAVYIDLASKDQDQMMGGLAVKALFLSPKLSEKQWDTVALDFSAFGDWTKKLITREDLTRRLAKDELDMDLYRECLAYKNNFKDNRLLIDIIGLTNSKQILKDFEENGCGKILRKMALKKIAKIDRDAANK